MTDCISCGSDSRGRKYCYDCNSIRSNACSVINQNKKKLIKLCLGRTKYSSERVYKFRLYVNNIEDGLRILDEFNRKEDDFFRNYELYSVEKDSE